MEVAGEVPGANVPRDGHAALSYDTATNRLTTAGFEYDAAGNQIRAKRADGSFQRMVYDAANRLVEVRNDANTVVYESYRYGVGNGRVTSESSGVRTYYAGGGGQASIEYVEAVSGGSLVWSKTYIYAGGSLLATITPNGASEYVEYHHPDRLGTRLISNNQNTSVQEQENLPYGAALSIGSTRQFTSYDRSSSTGLDYAVNRRYDSLQGRFTQVDPIEMDAVDLGDPQSLNLYTYCGNDPVNHTDPEGLFFKKLFRSIGRIVAKILKWAAVVVAVALVVIAIGTGQPQLLLVAGLLFGVAFGGEVVQRILSGVNVGLSAGSFGRIGIGGTAGFNPNVSISASASNLNRYISNYNGQDGDVLNFSVSCPVSGTIPGKCPGQGAPWYRRLGGWVWENKGEIALEVGMTFVPPARIAGLAFRAGRWAYRGVQAARAARAARRGQELVAVSRWGRSGLQAGDWVTKGNATGWNYFKTGKWERTPWNEHAPFSSGETFLVPRSTLQLPRGRDIHTIPFGHRRYTGPHLP